MSKINLMDTSTSKTEASSKFSWKQPAIYLLLVLMGAGGTFLGTRFIKANPQLFAGSTAQQTQQFKSLAPLQTETAVVESLPPADVDSNFIVVAVEKVGPAVVRIDASRTVNRSRSDMFEDPIFRRFFGRNQPQAPQQRRVQQGVGSGFALSEDGHIITNAHVIDGADTVEVTLKDGRSFTGKVLGEDPVTDVAVVKIESSNLPAVTIGDSALLQPGEWAIAIGNPLGLDNTVTAGIISATERSSNQVGVPDKRVGFIQTDAAINPGNSGGPLLNAAGEVIGMNTAIISGAQGLGFAIPINSVQEIAQQLISKGKVEHPYLGIEMIPLTPEIRKEINAEPNSGIRVETDQGVLISRIAEDAPAAKAGLRAGDVIQKIDNQPITKAETVQQLVRASKLGSPLQVEINRNGKTLKLEVKPGPMPVQPE
jgi:Do/DeqQ family serine protease